MKKNPSMKDSVLGLAVNNLYTAVDKEDRVNNVKLHGKSSMESLIEKYDKEGILKALKRMMYLILL